MSKHECATHSSLLADLHRIGEFLPHEPDDTETDAWRAWNALDSAYTRVAEAIDALVSETAMPTPATPSATLTPDERAELERLRSAPYYWAQNNGAISEDSDRYRWFRDNCELDRQEEIIEAAEGVADLLDHHIDKGRCGL